MRAAFGAGLRSFFSGSRGPRLGALKQIAFPANGGSSASGAGWGRPRAARGRARRRKRGQNEGGRRAAPRRSGLRNGAAAGAERSALEPGAGSRNFRGRPPRVVSGRGWGGAAVETVPVRAPR